MRPSIIKTERSETNYCPFSLFSKANKTSERRPKKRIRTNWVVQTAQANANATVAEIKYTEVRI